MTDRECNLDEYEKQNTWKYHIIWKIEEIKEVLSQEETIIKLKEKIINLVMTESITLKELKIDKNEVELILEADNQPNINKVIKNVQKEMLRVYKLKECKQPYLMTTQSKVCAKEDIRIQKLIDALVLGEYYDLDEGMTSTDLKALKGYLSQRNLGMIDYNEQVFLVDREALRKAINLNCFECTKIHEYGCCCGSPCRMSSKNMKLFDQHMLSMEEAVKAIDLVQYKRLVANGGFMTANGLIKAYDGHCALLVQHEGVYKCMAHKYALDEHIPIYDLCPLSCLMYPLEMIELTTDKRKKVVLFTSVVDDAFANQFGRWGSYEQLEVELRCVHQEAHNTIFKAEDYRPVYQVNEGLITHEFGEAPYRGIKKLCE